MNASLVHCVSRTRARASSNIRVKCAYNWRSYSYAKSKDTTCVVNVHASSICRTSSTPLLRMNVLAAPRSQRGAPNHAPNAPRSLRALLLTGVPVTTHLRCVFRRTTAENVSV